MTIKGEIERCIKRFKTRFNLPPNIKIPEEYYTRTPYLKIEITNACNARCNFCAYKKMTRPKVNIDEKIFDKVVKEYIDMGGNSIALAPIVGEVLLNRNIIKYAKQLKEHPKIKFVMIYTNLLTLSTYTEEEIETLLDSIDSLNISTGANRDDFKASFGVDKFEQFIKGVECLVRYKNKHERFPETLFMGRSIKKVPDVDPRLIDMVKYLTDKPLDWLPCYLDWSGDIDDFGQEQPIIRVDKSNRKIPTCNIGLTGFVVFSNGDVGFCPCSDTHAKLLIGNITKQSLKEILLGKKRREFIDSFEKGTMHEHCAKCGFYQAVSKKDFL